MFKKQQHVVSVLDVPDFVQLLREATYEEEDCERAHAACDRLEEFLSKAGPEVRRLGNVIASNQPRLLFIPFVRLLFRPACCLRPHYTRTQAEYDQPARPDGLKSLHLVNSA